MRWIVILALVMLGGCSAMDIAKNALGMGGGGPSLSIDAENTAGDKEELNGVGQVGDSVEAENVSITNTTDPFILLLLVMGWLLPGPAEIYRGIKGEVKGMFMFFRG